ncbi:hypothetical protein CBM2634_U420002 [Cupriavidus taiwanensis]|uniref:Uncharacterized protein n=1 Tax=Cupriavidus taiwanensis TaxID=164546 RepID=A0A375JCQ3_9BURK|nr:hypothetical protein CBM2634_U420002 [Cupriavidus taiwanensis]
MVIECLVPAIEGREQCDRLRRQTEPVTSHIAIPQARHPLPLTDGAIRFAGEYVTPSSHSQRATSVGLSESVVDKAFLGNRQILHEKYDDPTPANFAMQRS